MQHFKFVNSFFDVTEQVNNQTLYALSIQCAKMQTIYAIDHLAKTQKWQTAIMQRKKNVKEIVCQALPSNTKVKT